MIQAEAATHNPVAQFDARESHAQRRALPAFPHLWPRHRTSPAATPAPSPSRAKVLAKSPKLPGARLFRRPEVSTALPSSQTNRVPAATSRSTDQRPPHREGTKTTHPPVHVGAPTKIRDVYVPVPLTASPRLASRR